MGGAVAAGAEVAGGSDQALAEVPEPDAVDDDAGGEGVVLAGDRLRELEAAAALGEGLAVFRQDRRELAGDLVAAVAGVAADEDHGFGRGRIVNQRHGSRRSAGVACLEGFAALADVADARALVALEELLGFRQGKDHRRLLPANHLAKLLLLRVDVRLGLVGGGEDDAVSGGEIGDALRRVLV